MRSMHTAGGTVLGLLLLLLLLSAAPVSAMAGEWADESFDSLPESQRRTMPDHNELGMRVQLRCSACHWCVVELHNDILEVETEFNKTRLLDIADNKKAAGTGRRMRKIRDEPDQDRVDEIIDDLCERHYPNYGLHVDAETNTVKHKYTKLAGRVQGAWVTRLFHNTCSEFILQFQVDDKKRTWDYLRRKLWGAQKNIEEAKFMQLCPQCNNEYGRKGFPTRAESLMWVDEKTRMEEDWDL